MSTRVQAMRTAVARTPLRSVVTGERLFALLIAAMGVVWTLDGFGYGFIDPNGGVIGAGFVPVISGIPMGVLGLIAFRQTFVGRAKEEGPGPRVGTDQLSVVATPRGGDDEASGAPLGHEESSPHLGYEESGTRQNNWAPLLLFAGMTAALVVSSWLGLIPALGLMMFGAATVIERQNVVTSAVIAAAICFVAWLVFVHFLHVPLSFGILSQH